MSRLGKFLLLGVVLAAVATAAYIAAGKPKPREVRVFAASSLTDVMATLARDYEAKTGVKVVVNAGASSTLARQIAQGAPCDVFLSADEEWADFVEKAGKVEPGTRRDLLTNTMVLVCSSDVVAGSVRDLHTSGDEEMNAARNCHLFLVKNPAIKHLAVADPDHVPAGRYARQILERCDAWTEMESRLIRCETVRAALSLVMRGEAEAGIVFRTDAAITGRMVHRVVFGGKDTKATLDAGFPVARYPFLCIRGAGSHATEFGAFLVSEAASRVFTDAGFGLAEPR